MVKISSLAETFESLFSIFLERFFRIRGGWLLLEFMTSSELRGVAGVTEELGEKIKWDHPCCGSNANSV